MSFSITFRREREGGGPNICQRTDSELWFGGNRACNILPLQRLMGRQPKEEEKKKKSVDSTRDGPLTKMG